MTYPFLTKKIAEVVQNRLSSFAEMQSVKTHKPLPNTAIHIFTCAPSSFGTDAQIKSILQIMKHEVYRVFVKNSDTLMYTNCEWLKVDTYEVNGTPDILIVTIHEFYVPQIESDRYD